MISLDLGVNVYVFSLTFCSSFRVSDKQTLEQILTPYIHPTESDPVTRQKWALPDNTSQVPQGTF